MTTTTNTATTTKRGSWLSFDSLEVYGHETDSVWCISRRGDHRTQAQAVANARTYDKQFIGYLGHDETRITNVMSVRPARENTSDEMRTVIASYPQIATEAR